MGFLYTQQSQTTSKRHALLPESPGPCTVAASTTNQGKDGARSRLELTVESIRGTEPFQCVHICIGVRQCGACGSAKACLLPAQENEGVEQYNGFLCYFFLYTFSMAFNLLCRSSFPRFLFILCGTVDPLWKRFLHA